MLDSVRDELTRRARDPDADEEADVPHVVNHQFHTRYVDNLMQ